MTARSLSAVLALLVSASAVVAQEKWETFHATADAFTVEIPSPLEQPSENGKDGSRKYLASKDDTYLYVFSDPSSEADQTGKIVAFVKAQGWHLSVGKTLGAPLHFQDEFGYWHTVTSISTGSRIFIVQAVSADDTSPVAERFVSTFRPGAMGSGVSSPKEADLPVGPAIVLASESPLPVLKPDVAGQGTGSSNGPGTGSGSGTGSGTGTGFGTGGDRNGGIITGVVKPPPPVGNRALKILTKPRPAYTELGRLYEINGTVILKVSFLESGKVGVVRVVKGLPFGLTNQAIIAAKRMTFEPQLKDGQPEALTKQVEYNFFIY